MPEPIILTRGNWETLRGSRPLSDDEFGFHRISPDGMAPELGIFVDASGGYHFLVVTQGRQTREMPPDFAGVRSRQKVLSDHREVLDIYSPAAHGESFTALCNNLIVALVGTQRDPWAAAGSVIRNWQSAFKPTKLGMDKIKQVGLFGELWVLENLLIRQHGPDAIEFWGGPEGETHDFSGRGLHIETKTTRGSGMEFMISKVDQLSVPAGKRLILATVRVEESVGSRASIATLIDRILGLLVANPASRDIFLTKLIKLGWADELRRSGDLVKLEFKEADLYEVAGEFPRLPEDFVKPAGVTKLEYTIDLSNISGMDGQEVRAAIALM